MSLLLEADQHRPGLRERKKAKTRAAIQEHALRLFAEQGYEATTVGEIADAADVSPSTFFRYFPTKEDVVLYDDLDPLLLAALEGQPLELGPVAAIRAAMSQVFDRAPAGVLAQQDARAALILSVPELRMRMLDEAARSMFPFVDIIAKRAGKGTDDIAVQALAGAVIGVVVAAWIGAGGLKAPDYIEKMDEALAQLEAGFPTLSS